MLSASSWRPIDTTSFRTSFFREKQEKLSAMVYLDMNELSTITSLQPAHFVSKPSFFAVSRAGSIYCK
jgi:hypothetical protein